MGFDHIKLTPETKMLFKEALSDKVISEDEAKQIGLTPKEAEEISNCFQMNGQVEIGNVLFRLEKSDNGKKQDAANTILTEIRDIVKGLQGDFSGAVEKILTAVAGNTEKLEEIKQVLEAIKKQQPELQKEILEYISAVGFNLSMSLNAILEAIGKLNADVNKNNKDLIAKLEDMLQKALAHYDNKSDQDLAAILDAMSKIRVSGDKVDLSGLEAMLRELLNKAEQGNDLLASIDAKADVIAITIERAKQEIIEKLGKTNGNINALLKKLDDFMNLSDENSRKILAKMDTIINLLNNIKPEKYDDTALMAKLDAILAAIKDHDITVDITGEVTCNCNCGNNGTHEGIIGDLNDILK